ncbi:MAG: hypothetical protein ACJ8F7_21770 [Gemmataceae bacterium]
MPMTTAFRRFPVADLWHCLRRIAVATLACYGASQCDAGSVSAATDPINISLTADTEGHVGPCRECPFHPGLGGLTRRATSLARLRKEQPERLLVDAGNALIGAESLESKGQVIVAAYDAMGYDAVNLCHRDFWLGKVATLALLKDAKFAVLSANFLYEGNGELLARPYIVKKVNGQRIALVGVAEPPAGRDFLPHLKEHLAGIRIQPPAEALAKWLPKAKGESDQVILLYYGSAAGLEPIREKFAHDLAAILVGGIRPENLPEDSNPPLVGTSNHGRHLAQVRLSGTGRDAKAEVTQMAIEPTIKPDPEMEKILSKYQSPAAK